MKNILLSLIFCASIFYTAFTKSSGVPVGETALIKDSTAPLQMKQYWFAFLYKGEIRNQDSLAAAKIQNAHIANINRLAAEGKIIMAGPMGYDKDLRGIFIIDAKDSAQAASYIKTDSAIITGRLRFELHPWWTAKGKYEFK